MTSPRTPFFWRSKVRVPKVAHSKSQSGDCRRQSRRVPMSNCTWCNAKGCVSDGDAVYSPGRRRKKKARMIISATATEKGFEECCATKAIARRTRSGSGFTRAGGGSCLFQKEIRRERRKSIFPTEFRRGSWDPRLWNVWPTCRR